MFHRIMYQWSFKIQNQPSLVELLTGKTEKLTIFGAHKHLHTESKVPHSTYIYPVLQLEWYVHM